MRCLLMAAFAAGDPLHMQHLHIFAMVYVMTSLCFTA
jgi:hypothetical protein